MEISELRHFHGTTAPEKAFLGKPLFADLSAVKSRSENGLDDGHVIEPPRPACGIGGWVETRKSTEIVGEMRLIVIPTAQRQLGPGHIHPVVQSTQGDLKAVYARPGFWAHTNLFAKYLGESALAYAHRLGALGDAEAGVAEKMDPLLHQLRTAVALVEALVQQHFERSEFVDRGR